MSGERVKLGTNTAVSVIAVAAILLMVNYLSMRHYYRADWTSSGMYTLSDKTEKVLSVLDSEVSLYVLWSQGDPRFVDAKELLDNYTGLSSKIKLEVIDPDISPERVQIIIDSHTLQVEVYRDLKFVADIPETTGYDQRGPGVDRFDPAEAGQFSLGSI